MGALRKCPGKCRNNERYSRFQIRWFNFFYSYSAVNISWLNCPIISWLLIWFFQIETILWIWCRVHVKLSKYAVNNYPHFVSLPLTFCIFNIFDKNKYRFDVCCCRTCLCCLYSLCRCTFSLGGHRSVVSKWMIFLVNLYVFVES